ncbi:hypothetical protein LDG_5625 [Legionella drancourtii LLAP12]|uniref:Uncharacterized protein n=1 Tax=Legionella drancourtii LLAP12 TaxID=658187 RepID=G9EKA1_9GAMM|nr:hypothetical protein LDG_5625 [Legionella drancourtii LLAP12]
MIAPPIKSIRFTSGLKIAAIISKGENSKHFPLSKKCFPASEKSNLSNSENPIKSSPPALTNRDIVPRESRIGAVIIDAARRLKSLPDWYEEKKLTFLFESNKGISVAPINFSLVFLWSVIGNLQKLSLIIRHKVKKTNKLLFYIKLGHRQCKQNARLTKSPTRTVITQCNPIHDSIIADCTLEKKIWLLIGFGSN